MAHHRWKPASHPTVWAQLLRSCPSLCDPTGCSPPDSSLRGILQAIILGWVAMSSSRGLPDPGTEPTSLMFPALRGGFFTTSTTWEAPKLLTDLHICVFFPEKEMNWVAPSSKPGS